MSQRSQRLLLALPIVLAAISVYAATRPRGMTVCERSPLNVAMQHGISLAKACRVYSLDHEGRTPASLRELLEIEEFGATSEKLLYLDPASGERTEWLYHPIERSSPTDKLHLASPVPTPNGLRIVVIADCSAKVIKDEEFQSILHRQDREIN